MTTTMGWTLTGTVLDKTTYRSTKRNEDVFEIHMHLGGSTIVTVTGVKADVWGAVQASELLTIKVNVRAFADNGKGRLFVSFIELA